MKASQSFSIIFCLKSRDKNVWQIFHGTAVSSDITFSDPTAEAGTDGYNDLLQSSASVDHTLLPLPTANATFTDRVNYITDVANSIGDSVSRINPADLTDPSKSALDIVVNPVQIEPTDSPDVAQAKQDQLNQQKDDANAKLVAFEANLNARTIAIGSEDQQGTLVSSIFDSLSLITDSVLNIGTVLVKFVKVIFLIVGETAAITGGVIGKVSDIAYSFLDSAASFDSAVRHGLADYDSALAQTLGTLDSSDPGSVAVPQISNIGADLLNSLYGEQGSQLLKVTSQVETAQASFDEIASNVTTNINSSQGRLKEVSAGLDAFEVPKIEFSDTGEIDIPSGTLPEDLPTPPPGFTPPEDIPTSTRL